MIRKPHSKLAQAVALAAGITAGLAAFSAQAAYPEKPVKMTVGYAPGSSTDIVGRIVADGLAAMWKQPVIIDSHPGAAGNIAADIVAKAAPDGYDILFAQNGTAISVAANPHLPYNGLKDIIPVAQVTATPHLLIVNSQLPVKSVAELTALAKAKPDSLSFGSSGVGNSDHMAGELYKVLAGIKALHVPYKGGAPAATDLIAGQIQFYFAGMPVGMAQYKGGKVRALAVTSVKRFPGLPEIPTMQEGGVKDYDMTLWQGLFVPAGTPEAVVDFIATSTLKMVEEPAMKERLTKAGVTIAPLSRSAFGKMYVSDIARWKEVIPKAGIKLE
ncbi:MAG TPA: tripartite tricarboxylate transporter substrate binding protein [Burkholderiales bacterium]|jgi:tripartite-type tricarboxylate transporter receptor subunit TctC